MTNPKRDLLTDVLLEPGEPAFGAGLRALRRRRRIRKARPILLAVFCAMLVVALVSPRDWQRPSGVAASKASPAPATGAIQTVHARGSVPEIRVSGAAAAIAVSHRVPPPIATDTELSRLLRVPVQLVNLGDGKKTLIFQSAADRESVLWDERAD